jgi:hypothetical protein
MCLLNNEFGIDNTTGDDRSTMYWRFCSRNYDKYIFAIDIPVYKIEYDGTLW